MPCHSVSNSEHILPPYPPTDYYCLFVGMAEARTLKYGDVVRIHGMSKGDSLDKGILSAKGYWLP